MLFSLQSAICCQQSFAQHIDSVEYFFDTDPGVGNGTMYAVTPSDSITDSVYISLSGLNPGFHNLFFRVKDTNNTWSLYEGNTIFIQDTLIAAQASFDTISSEYFYDTDPGVGNGTAMALMPGDSILDTTFAVTAGLLPGFHNLYVRVKDSNNVWSLYEGGTVFLYDTLTASTVPVSHPIELAEYFFDQDSAVGYAIPMNAFATADSIEFSDTLATDSLTVGTHYLQVRVRDTMNVWSLYESRAFVICNLVPAADFSADTACFENATVFTDLSGNLDTSFNYTYEWDFDSNGSVDDTTEGNTTHNFSATGTHTVTLVVNNTNGCVDTVVKVIYVDSLPTGITFIIPVDTICKDDTLTLSGGNPPGGVYSGPGVYGGAMYCDSVKSGYHTLFYTYYNSDSCSATVSDLIFVSQCTGIQEHGLSGVSVNISPNPFYSTTLLKVENATNEYRDLQFVLFDIYGKEIRNITLESPQLRLDRENMPAGVYLYKLIGKDGNYVSGKLVVAN